MSDVIGPCRWDWGTGSDCRCGGSGLVVTVWDDEGARRAEVCDRHPLIAVDDIDLAAELAAGRMPWPPYRLMEGPACGAVDDVPADRTTDGLGARLVCQWPAGHDGRHGMVRDVGAGRAMLWPARRG